jgi:hypothetical protein
MYTPSVPLKGLLFSVMVVVVAIAAERLNFVEISVTAFSTVSVAADNYCCTLWSELCLS